MHPFVTAFMMIWLMTAGLASFIIIRGWFAGSIHDPGVLAVPVGVLGGFPVVVLFGRWLAHDEERFLVTFVAGVIDARLNHESLMT